ncbi:hypothetical protein BJ875DRAFT_449250 [Amylocarpus encephaloides]|uniref:Alpha and gamma adaptin binding protein p34 n=1 Tax=Amylocarpus encephaloides TaxID=45428 RepID=A0A9P7YSJ9_9HELO|nr:hypothetical protein BJ875DRAFT_449250 [Amylocarpus encephaloides]
MDVSNPRRILAVSKPDSGLLDVVKELTGSTSTVAADSIAGTTHEYSISTSYYKAKVPIWLDEITSPSSWSKDFLTPEACEVLTVLGAFVVCFRKPVDALELEGVKDLLKNVQEVVKEGCGYSWDGVCLAVAMKQSTTPYLDMSHEDWEDTCQDFGFEFIDFEKSGRNEFHEPMGVERLREALEATDWVGNDDDFDVEDALNELDLDGDDADSLGFGIDPKEMEEEMKGMKQAIYGGNGAEGDDDQDEEVEKLQAMMLKMQAVRDMGVDLPESERKRLAAKTVGEIIKTL